MTTDPNNPLFQPLHTGAFELPNRVLMAPLTRSRAHESSGVPAEMTATYYAQRAGAGLIVAEATPVSAMGKGYAFIPGIYSDDQVAGWARVTDAVHDAGGRIFLQLFHAGRIAHTELLPEGASPVAPSAITAESQTYTSQESGMVGVSAPRALETDEVPGIVDEFRTGAINAKRAGFDGVEIHGANGYLLDQFTRSGTNRRTDAYGGSAENRVRLPLEVARAVVSEWGPGRVGYRVSPLGTFNDMADDNPAETFGLLAEGLGEAGVAYLHAVESFAGSPRDVPFFAALRAAFPGLYIANGGYTKQLAEEALDAGRADAVAFGQLYIANPDLTERLRRDALLTEPDPSTFYGGTEKGYTDYPTLAEADAV